MKLSTLAKSGFLDNLGGEALCQIVSVDSAGVKFPKARAANVAAELSRLFCNHFPSPSVVGAIARTTGHYEYWRGHAHRKNYEEESPARAVNFGDAATPND